MTITTTTVDPRTSELTTDVRRVYPWTRAYYAATQREELYEAYNVQIASYDVFQRRS